VKDEYWLLRLLIILRDKKDGHFARRVDDYGRYLRGCGKPLAYYER